MYFTEFNIKTQKINFKISYTQTVCVHMGMYTHKSKILQMPQGTFLYSISSCL